MRHVGYDMHVAPVPTRPGVLLKTEHFNVVRRLLNYTSNAELGRAIGMDRVTISRAEEGQLGERFIAGILALFAERKDELAAYGVGVAFDDLFEVGDKPVRASSDEESDS